jgi:HEAT repeat protein
MNKIPSPDNQRRALLEFKLIPVKLVLLANLTLLLSLCPIVQAQGDGSAKLSNQPTTQKNRQPESDGVMSSMFSGTGILVMLGLMCCGLLVARTVRSKSETGHNGGGSTTADQRSTRSTGSALEKKTAKAKTPHTVFGAYRIKQEVAKVVLGHPHRAEILSARAPEDLRAIETALLNFVTAPESTDDERRRAREALEKYGFVARYCAALLRASDPFERTSAARSLGQMGLLSALPFLLDSLYDAEAIVRNQAIASVGELKDPEALDALRDAARVCPDLPANLINRALNGPVAGGMAAFGPENVLEITQLKPASKVEDLAENTNEEKWVAAMAKLPRSTVDERLEVVKTLGEFPVQESVSSLTDIVRNDPQPSVRSSAVASLASINHESVFPGMLLAMADESREVRASAARAISRLSFDRSGAYVRLMEGCNQASLKEFATACVKAGIVAQNIDRLSSSDRRQAYEAFSLISLLAKAKATETLTEAIANHSNINVRLSVIHLLATTGQPQVLKELQELASQENMPEEVKTALLEAMYKLESRPNPEVTTQESLEQGV